MNKIFSSDFDFIFRILQTKAKINNYYNSKLIFLLLNLYKFGLNFT